MRFRKISSEHRRKTRKIKTDSRATAQVNKVKNEGSHRSKITFKIKQELNESVTKMKPTQTNRRAQRGHRNHNKQLSTKFMGWEKQHQYAVKFTIWLASQIHNLVHFISNKVGDTVVCWWAPHILLLYRVLGWNLPTRWSLSRWSLFSPWTFCHSVRQNDVYSV